MAHATESISEDMIVATELPASPRQTDFIAPALSIVIHLLLIIILGVWVLPNVTNVQTILQMSVGDLQPDLIETADITFPVDLEIPTATLEPVSVEVMPPPPALNHLVSLEPETASVVSLPESDSVSPVAEAVSTSSSVESAVDQITSEMTEKLELGDLLIVWLLDSSQSLVDDRQRVASRLTPFYEQFVDDRTDQKHELLSVVVSFGKAMRERVAPTPFGDKIVSAVADLPIDRSGKENVFDAVARCARHYRSEWTGHQVAIVVWTDESGDDVRYLEQAIKTCRENQASVSVVGPSSVLGADTGLHSYGDPKTNSIYQIPVNRGPDSAMAERIELGYWYMTRFRGRRRGGGQLPSWLGGQDLEGILSGFSPYALTRLALQTGGTYTIFDRPEDRGPFDPITMQRYAPSYSSFSHYEESIRSHPLRNAVMKAVEELNGKKIDAPETMLLTKRTGDRLFDFVRLYYSPNEFRTKLRLARGRLIRQALRQSKLIDAALRHLVPTDGDDSGFEGSDFEGRYFEGSDFEGRRLEGRGLEELYGQETSPRWRAWYDLTRGRLLATRVRLEEYRITLNSTSENGVLASSTNHIILVASPMLRSQGEFLEDAEEAERLLRRCVDENRGTPWETLAQRELDFALGVSIREMSLTPQPGGPTVRQPNLPRF